MSARRLLLAAAVVSALASFSPATTRGVPAPAQPAQGDIDHAKHDFIGVINGNSVYIRSAPREDAYPAMKLDKGAKVTVVGMKYNNWLQILPPEGSFALVPQAYVQRHASGSVGRVTREWNAKVGSTLTQVKTAPMAKVDEGQDVEIIGEQDEYYKIKPPKGSFLYVNKGFVDPYKVLPNDGEKARGQIVDAATNRGHAPPANRNPRVATGPTTHPSAAGNAVAFNPEEATGTAQPATTQPTEAAVDVRALFDKLEADFKAANGKPITEQPLDTLQAGYTKLLAQDGLDPTTRKISQIRLSTLKLRGEAKAEFLAMQKKEKDEAQRQQALVAEREELQQQIKKHEVQVFAAVGTLRASSLQRGPTTLYRLTDPATGRTVVYLRSNDGKYASLIGQFIGVKGAINTDAALSMKVIDQPADAQNVDPNQVNTKVTAQIIPPSLIGNTRSASTGNE